MHAHVVAGIDDGPATDGETDALLDALAAQGTTTVVTTPHVDARFDGTPDDVAARVRALCDRRPEAPGVLAGAEVHPGRLDDVLAAGAARFTLGGGGTLLVEAATDVPGAVLEHCLRRLEHAGVRTLFAHAERSRAFAHDDGLARDLVARGARLQINARSLCADAGDARQVRMEARGRRARERRRVRRARAQTCDHRGWPMRRTRLRSGWARTRSTRSCIRIRRRSARDATHRRSSPPEAPGAAHGDVEEGRQ